MRIPDNAEESYALGFMIGYLGDVPDALADMIPDPEYVPSFIENTLTLPYKRGYDAGVAFYCDHMEYDNA